MTEVVHAEFECGFSVERLTFCPYLVSTLVSICSLRQLLQERNPSKETRPWGRTHEGLYLPHLVLLKVSSEALLK